MYALLWAMVSNHWLVPHGAFVVFFFFFRSVQLQQLKDSDTFQRTPGYYNPLLLPFYYFILLMFFYISDNRQVLTIITLSKLHH